MARQLYQSGPAPRFGTGGPPRLPVPGQRPSQRSVPQHHPPVGVLPAIQSLLYVLVFALFLMTFTVQPIRIPSSSMEPTLLVGDFLLLDKQAVAPDPRFGGLLPPATIRRGDVVVFHDPVDDPSVHLVKRVIALPGDRLHLRNGVVFLNGKPLQETYAVHRPAPSDIFRDDFPLLVSRDAGVNPDWWIRLRSLIHAGDITIPPNNYFVMGDNRNDSEDSRYWGFVPRDDIVGKPLLIYFSWKQSPEKDPEDEDSEDNPSPNQAQSQSKNQGLLRDLGTPDQEHPPHSAQPSQGPTDFARWNRTFRVIH